MPREKRCHVLRDSTTSFVAPPRFLPRPRQMFVDVRAEGDLKGKLSGIIGRWWNARIVQPNIYWQFL